MNKTSMGYSLAGDGQDPNNAGSSLTGSARVTSVSVTKYTKSERRKKKKGRKTNDSVQVSQSNTTNKERIKDLKGKIQCQCSHGNIFTTWGNFRWLAMERVDKRWGEVLTFS